MFANLLVAVLVAADAVQAAAVATPPTNTFSVDQVSKGEVLLNGPLALRNALYKYHADIPANVVSAAVAATTSGSVPNSPQQYDKAYLVPVTIGTPAKTLMLDFDTGSSDLWAFSGLMPVAQQGSHTLYRPKRSTTAKKLAGATWKISYGDGSGANGVVYTDKVKVGSITATSQAVEPATSVAAMFQQNADQDGLLGLAFSSINTVRPTKQKTFFDTVKSQLAKPVFAAYLRAGAPGSYDFGYIDSKKYTGSIAYTPVNSGQGFWNFTGGPAFSGNTNIGHFGAAIADTGTSLILAPSSIVNGYWNTVSGAGYNSQVGGIIFPCGSTLPNFGITIGGQKRTVPGKYLNYASVGSGFCYGGLQANSGLPFAIVGDVFLKGQYVIFDASKPQLGFAQQA